MGFVVLGLMTSMPEMFIAGQSLIDGTPQLSFGNLVGASVVLMTLVLGSLIIIQNGVTVSEEVRRHDVLWMSVLILAPVVSALDGSVSRADGLVIAILYLFYLFHFAWRHSYVAEYGALDVHRQSANRAIAVGLASFLGLAIFSKLAVELSLRLALILGLTPTLVGLLMHGLGTNLPELSIAWSALRHHHEGIVVGDLIGSAAGNSFVAAVLAVISPLTVNHLGPVAVAGLTLVVSLGIFTLSLRRHRRMTRDTGLVFVLLYTAFVAAVLLAPYH